MEDRDFKVIQALKENGSDVTKPHEIDFFFDFSTFDEAAPVAQAIDKDGFVVKVFENDDGSYTIEAKKTLIPDVSVMQELTRKFDSLTEKHGGNYDGWGTEVVE